MDDDARPAEATAYTANLDFTLKELQRRVQEHEDELQRLKANDTAIAQTPVGQAEVVKAALEEVTNTEPFLPHASSTLPALLALRRTHQTIIESRAYLESQKSVLSREKRQLEAGQAHLRDQTLLSEALDARIVDLKAEVSSSARAPPGDGARKKKEELQKKKAHYDADSKRLFRALDKFIDEHLAVMLAAEELGGPVVGDLMDVDGADLASGFSAQVKLNKPKEGRASLENREDKRQRRLDEIWGPAEGVAARRDEDEVAAAGREMKELIQALMGQLQDAGGDSSSSYVVLSRESAAARFLVRSKVAQFHAKDASRLRLIDFGREFD
ncbi:uncharacterized protein J7T54_006027 [Emericellopsis cladophorae]|uniref:Centromere protein Cenp-K n=1 Tax=Emericellopsis cladophorae TaxID=2686198 RepID=A0A9P9Y9P0_9HYPO|nr:uncharacterized protein J7T54_006027 [Emericellopsis cladophorae]KAI6785693.1 hypothetical protein J7T54_006027 [Emericellopsis cladophorae]